MSDVAAEKSRKVAEHAYVDAAGAKVAIEKATGISYALVANADKGVEKTEAFVYQIPGAVAGSPVTMLALFGGRTKATNESSSNRQNRAKGESEIDDRQAVADWFGELADGVWPADERTRGPRYDMDRLAEAAVTVYLAMGKKVKGGATALAERLRTDVPVYDSVRKNLDVVAEYARLTALAAKAKAPATTAAPDTSGLFEDDAPAGDQPEPQAETKANGRKGR